MGTGKRVSWASFGCTRSQKKNSGKHYKVKKWSDGSRFLTPGGKIRSRGKGADSWRRELCDEKSGRTVGGCGRGRSGDLSETARQADRRRLLDSTRSQPSSSGRGGGTKKRRSLLTGRPAQKDVSGKHD